MIRRLLQLLTLAAIAAVLVGAWLLTTAAGARFVLAFADGFAPGSIAYDELDGNLLEGMEVSGFRWTDGEQSVEIARLQTRWSLRNVGRRIVEIQQLELIDPAIRIVTAGESEQQATPSGLPSVSLPVTVRLAELELQTPTVSIDGESLVLPDLITMRAVFDDQTLEVESLSMQLGPHSAQLAGRASLGEPWQYGFALSANTSIDGVGTVDAEIDISGEDYDVRIDRGLIRSDQGAARVSGDVGADDVTMELALDWDCRLVTGVRR